MRTVDDGILLVLTIARKYLQGKVRYHESRQDPDLGETY